MKRKLTRATLSELELHAEIVKLFEQKRIVGGGNGTYQDPFTYSEWLQYSARDEVYYYDQTGHLCWSGVIYSGYIPGKDYGYSSGYDSGCWGCSYSCVITHEPTCLESDVIHSGGSTCDTQEKRGTCVPHVMSWAATILGQDWRDEGWFVKEYRNCFNKNFDIDKGIAPNELDPYLKAYFSVEKLNNTANSIQQALTSKLPVIGTLKNGVCPSIIGLHEVLINDCDASGKIVCTNPGNDKKETYSLDDFEGNYFYRINSILPYYGM